MGIFNPKIQRCIQTDLNSEQDVNAANHLTNCKEFCLPSWDERVHVHKLVMKDIDYLDALYIFFLSYLFGFISLTKISIA